jgi:hypothetical protein
LSNRSFALEALVGLNTLHIYTKKKREEDSVSVSKWEHFHVNNNNNNNNNNRTIINMKK